METNVRVTEGGFTCALWSLLFLRVRMGPQIRFGKGGAIVWRLTKARHSDWVTATGWVFLQEAKVCPISHVCLTLICAQGRLKFRWIGHSGLESHLSPVSFTTWLISLQLFPARNAVIPILSGSQWPAIPQGTQYFPGKWRFSKKKQAYPNQSLMDLFLSGVSQKLLLMCLVVKVVSVDEMWLRKCKPSRK